MNPAVWIAFLAVFLLLFAGRRRARNLRRRDRRRRTESRLSMNVMIRQLLGKRCVVCLDGGFGGSLTGVLEALEDNWLSVRTGKTGALELVNLDYVNRIQELPEKKKSRQNVGRGLAPAADPSKKDDTIRIIEGKFST